MSEPLPLDQFVARQLASGRYQSYDELVEEALRLLQEREAEEDRTPANGETEGSDRGRNCRAATLGIRAGHFPGSTGSDS